MRALSIDFEPEAQPAWWRVLVASVVAIVGSLIADALIAAAAIAIWPHLKGYQHFLFTEATGQQMVLMNTGPLGESVLRTRSEGRSPSA